MSSEFIQIKNHIIKKDSVTGWSQPKPSQISVAEGDTNNQKDAWEISIYFDGNCLEIYFVEKETADETYKHILKIFGFADIIETERYR